MFYILFIVDSWNVNKISISISDTNLKLTELINTLNTKIFVFWNMTQSNFHSCTMHLAIINVFYYQLMHKRIVFEGVLKFTLKFTTEQPQHVPVWSPSSGSVLCELAKVRVLKFTLKQPHHVSALSPSSGSTLCELAEVTVLIHLVKIHHCG